MTECACMHANCVARSAHELTRLGLATLRYPSGPLLEGTMGQGSIQDLANR